MRRLLSSRWIGAGAASFGIVMMIYGICRGELSVVFAKRRASVWSVSALDKKKTSEWSRHKFQILWALLTNSYLIGFIQGKIYRGKLKNLCVPGLNCYSCPGALGSCPIGSLQAVIGSWNFKFAFYVSGFLVFTGALMGRLVCGWLCPFGLFRICCIKSRFQKNTVPFTATGSSES